MALRVGYYSWYISLLSSAKQQHEMKKFCVVGGTRATTVTFLNLYTVLHKQFQDAKVKQT